MFHCGENLEEEILKFKEEAAKSKPKLVKHPAIERSEELKCIKCGNVHQTSSNFCDFCGEDLEEAILEYKERNLPIQYNHENKTRQHSSEYKTSASGSRLLNFIGSCALDALCEALCFCLWSLYKKT